MYKRKYENLIQHLTNEHNLILLDSEIQEIENYIVKEIAVKLSSNKNTLTKQGFAEFRCVFEG